MSTDTFPVSWRNPDYIATVVGVLAIGAFYFHSASASSAPTADEITFVLLAVFLPLGMAYEVARRWL